MNILLQALPIDGNIVLRKCIEKSDQTPALEEREPERKSYYKDQCGAAEKRLAAFGEAYASYNIEIKLVKIVNRNVR